METNQASKANLLQIPAMIAGVARVAICFAQLTQLGATGFLLKFSRTAGNEADALGARIMNDAATIRLKGSFFESCRRKAGAARRSFYRTIRTLAIASRGRGRDPLFAATPIHERCGRLLTA